MISSPASRKRSRLPASDAGIVLALLVILFGGHLAFGANTGFLGLALSAALMVLACLAVAILGAPRVAPGLWIAAVLFAGVLGVGVFQLLPAPAGLAHPFWDWVEGPAAITLDKDATLRELVKLGGLAAAFGIGLVIGRDNLRASWFFRVLILASAVYAVWAFLDFFIEPTRVFGVERPFHRNRLSGGFLSANTAATLFAVLALLALAQLRRLIRRAGEAGDDVLNTMARTAAIPAVAFLFCVADLLVSASRAGALAFLGAALLFIAWELLSARARDGARAHLGLAIVLIGAGALALVVPISGAFLGERMETVGDAMDDRMHIFVAHWGAFRAAPWLGNGMGAFEPVNNALMTAENWRTLWSQGATHNVFIQWLEEAGLIGAGAMFACVAVIFGVMLNGLRRRRRARIWIRAILCASLILIVHGMFDFALQVPSVAAQWAALLGVGCGLATARDDAA